MENQLSEVLDNLLGLLLSEGAYEIGKDENGINVVITTEDAGRLIGTGGEFLEALQLIVSQIFTKKMGKFERIIIDVSGWRKQREEDLKIMVQDWAKQVLDSGQGFDLEPMNPWQRRVVHLAVQEVEGVESESVGEGRDRHIVIKPAGKKTKQIKK